MSRVVGGMMGIVAVAAATACGGGRSGVDLPAPGSDSITVNVLNENYYDAHIYAVYDGMARKRLGIVRGNRDEQEFDIPWYPRPLVFEIDLIIGGGVYVSRPFNVGPGAYFDLAVPLDLNGSVLFQRKRRDI